MHHRKKCNTMPSNPDKISTRWFRMGLISYEHASSPIDRLFLDLCSRSQVMIIYIYIYIYMYIYIYIVIHKQICFVLSELISVARFPKLGSKPGWLKHQSKILPLSHEKASVSEVNLNGYESQLLLFTYFRLTATESSIHTKSLAYTLMATQLLHSQESSTLHGHIYIYCHPQTDLFRSIRTRQCG